MEAGTVTITSKNMVVVPKKAMRQLQLREGQKLKVFVEENKIVLAPLLSVDELVGILKGPATAEELIRDARKNISRFD